MIHGRIIVEDVEIGWWQARRKKPLHDPDQESEYECMVRFNDVFHDTEFTVKHTYSDGAPILVSKVMLRYAEIRKSVEKRKAAEKRA